jgi:flagellar motility protein MotE (MotC chaperone)
VDEASSSTPSRRARETSGVSHNGQATRKPVRAICALPMTNTNSHSRRQLGATRVAFLAAAFGCWAGAADAEPKKAEPPAHGDALKAREQRATMSPEASRYCADVAATAGAARNARMEKELAELEQQIIRRTGELEAKRAELQAVIDRREAMVKKADERLVAIYARMRPDAAAAQFADMDEEMAAAMLMRLEPKKSSAILNEMEAARAVALTRKVAGLSTLPSTGMKQ